MTLCNLDDYRVSMADRRRVSTYREAMAKSVPGAVVCELGVGHLPIGLMALELGAERVYAIDSDLQALQLAAASLLEHGYGPDRYIAICGYPSTVSLPEVVDVIVAEPLSSLGFCDDTGTRMAQARERLLAPNGVMIPRRVRCFAALAGPTQFARQLRLWTGELAEITETESERLVEIFRTTPQTMAIEPSALLGRWQMWRELAFHDPGSHRQLRPLILTAVKAGVAHGVACCFEADLCDGVSLRTFPDAKPTPWQQAFTPFSTSLRIETGDQIFVELMAPEQFALGTQFETLVLGAPPSAYNHDAAIG